MDTLPSELLILIFQHLDNESRYSAERVCRSWRLVVASASCLWQSFEFAHDETRYNKANMLCRLFLLYQKRSRGRIKSIRLRSSNTLQDELLSESFAYLHSFYYGSGSPNAKLEGFLQRHPHIVNLSIVDIRIINVSFGKIFSLLPQLETLCLDRVHLTQSSTSTTTTMVSELTRHPLTFLKLDSVSSDKSISNLSFHKLKYLHIDGDSLSFFRYTNPRGCNAFPTLQYLELSRIDSNHRRYYADVKKSMPVLGYVRFARCTIVHSDGWLFDMLPFPQVTVLEVYKSNFLNNSPLKLLVPETPNIQEFYAKDCKAFSSVKSILNWTNLELLSLTKTENSAQALQQLKSSTQKNLLPRLETLYIDAFHQKDRECAHAIIQNRSNIEPGDGGNVSRIHRLVVAGWMKDDKLIKRIHENVEIVERVAKGSGITSPFEEIFDA